MQGNGHLRVVSNFLRKLPIWVYVFPFLCHIRATKYLLERSNQFRRQAPPYDWLATSMPDMSRFQWLVNALALAVFVPLIWMAFTTWPAGIFTSLFKYASILTLVRCVTTTMTVLPPNDHCVTPSSETIYPYLVGHCVDKMFSNHTAISLLVVLLYCRYGVLKGPALGAMFALQFFSSFLHVPTRSHYTIDVLVAYLLTTAVFFLVDV